MKYAVVYGRTHECGEPVTEAVVVNDLETALDHAADIRMNGGALVGIFGEVPGKIVITARLVAPVMETVALPDGSVTYTTKAAAKRKAAKLPPKKASAKAIEGTQRKIKEFLKAHPGSNAEAIGRGLRVPAKTLATPIRKLLDNKEVRRRGQKRHTKYYLAKAKS